MAPETNLPGRALWAAVLAALLLAGVVPTARGGDSAPNLPALRETFEDEDYWYFDIYKPFFVKAADGRPVMVSDRPRGRAMSFPLAKPPKSLRVFVVGGSVASLYDAPDSPVRPRLEEVLARLFPGREAAVLNCGMGAYDSYRESLIVSEIVAYEPDVVVFMTGNNDGEAITMGGPPSLAGLAGLKLRRLLAARAGAAAPKAGAPRRGPIPGGGPGAASFEKRLRWMIRSVRAAGAAAVVCTLPRRLGQPLAAPLPLADADFAAGWGALEKGDAKGAAEALARYAARESGDIAGWVSLGRAQERLGEPKAARASYLAAIGAGNEHDVNVILRRVAGEEGAVLADLVEALDAAAPEPGNEALLYDGVHWNRTSDPLVSAVIAAALARESRRALPASLAQAADASWLERETRGWERLAAAGPARSEEEFRRRVLRAVWDAETAEPGLSERSVDAFASLHRDYPGELDGLEQRKDEFQALARANVWTRGQMASFDRRWTAAVSCLGEAYRRQGLLARARACFEAALSLAPESAWPRLGLALCRAAAGDRDGARAELARIPEPEAWLSGVRQARAAAGLGLPPDGGREPPRGEGAAAGCPGGSPGFWAREAGGAAALPGGQGAALGFLDRAEACGPGPDERRVMTGILASLAEGSARTGERARALALLERAAGASGRTRGDDIGLRVRVAETYLSLGERGKAAAAAASGAAPSDPGALVALAALTLKAGDRRAAAALLAGAPPARCDAAALRGAAGLWRELGDWERAAAALEALAAKTPGDAKVLLDLAEARIRLGRRKEAERTLARAEKASPNAAQRGRIAELYRSMGRDAATARVLRGLGREQPGDGAVGLALAEAEASLGRDDAAGALLAGLPVPGPGPAADRAAALARRLAERRSSRGEHAEALALLERAAALKPRDAGLMLDLAAATARLGRRADALALVARAEGLGPGEADLHRAALAYGDLGEDGRCAAVLRRLLQQRPVAAYFSDLGVCVWRSGAAEEGTSYLRKAIETDPGFLPAYLSLAAVHARRGDHAEALRVCDRGLAVKSDPQWARAREALAKAREDAARRLEAALPTGAPR